MPDAQMYFPVQGCLRKFIYGFLKTGKFNPYELKYFLGSPYFWQELQYVLGGYCAALGLAYYLRGRGVSRPASYGAGLLLGFCGYWFSLFSAGHAGWFHWMLYGVFVFGLADRAVRKNKTKNWVLLGACLAWASPFQPDLFLLFSILSAAYFAWCCFRERKLPDWKGCLIAAAALFVIGTPSFINALFVDLALRDAQIEESKDSALSGGGQQDDSEARWIFVTNWSLPPSESLEFFIPRINGDTSCRMVLALGGRQKTGVRPYTGALGRPINAKRGNYRQHSLYVGWITCLLAVFAVGLAFARRRGASGHSPGKSGPSDVWFFSCAAVICWLLSLGRYCEPVYRVVFALPFGDYLRAPVKWHHLTELCLCALAGYGLDGLRRLLSAHRNIGGGIAVAVVAAIAVVGAVDLARIDKLYCAAIDLRAVKARNPAAEAILRQGKGKVADLVDGGNGLTSWSFSARDLEMTGDPGEQGVRFVWMPLSGLGDKEFSGWLKSRNARLLGTYLITATGIKEANGNKANAALFLFPDVAPQPDGGQTVPPFTILTLLGVVSVFGSAAALACAIKKGCG